MKTILVIEDEQAIRLNLLKILEAKGFRAIGAEDGTLGLKYAKAYLPELIICDILMPRLDGYGVLTGLRQNPETAMIPLIFLSAKADRSDVRQGMNLGADDYLSKPFTSFELLEAVSARLEKQVTITQPYLDEMKRAAESLNKAAYCDPLTNLPNRILLRQRLQEALRREQRQTASQTASQSASQTASQSERETANTPNTSVQSIAVLCLNIDRFHLINATLGHTTGDVLLQAIAHRLTECVGKNTVARIDGDEFGLVLEEMYDKSDVAAFTQSILTALAVPFCLNEQEITVQASIGIALFSEDGNNPDHLLIHADTAGRWCRKQGGNGYQFYSPMMDALDVERQLLEADLSTALERSEFLVYYQPQVNLVTGRVIGMEALVRWQHPRRGMISPATFIPIAEETGAIVLLGEWVLQAACQQAQAWQRLTLTPLRMSVNLSARQFKQKNLAAVVDRILQETQLDPKLLVLEMTETSVMEDVKTTIEILQDLKAKGIEISIDDFGTGYSSLNYLRRLPIDTLKIDQSFVNQVTENAQDAAIATAIIAMAQSLKLKVIAEGVETVGQLAFLKQHGCQAIQGHLYSPPLPAAEIEKLLIQDKRLP